MILDIDIGNSYLKWRLIDGSDVIKKGSQIVDSILDSSIFERDILENISGARLCSVVSEATTIALSKKLFSHYDVVLERACVSKFAGGVTCGYDKPSRLGVDRWLAMVAAYNKHHQAVLVIDAGSAVTLDVVDQNGFHLGGYILPGTSLMVESLRRGTKNVKVDVFDTQSLVPGKNTEDAAVNGILLSLISTIKTLTVSYPFKLVLSGGSAPAILKHLNMDVDYVPDLVLDGLSTPGVEFVSF